MPRKKIIWTLNLVTTFKDGDVQIIELPCAEAREWFNYLLGFYIDYGFKCIKSVSLCDNRMMVLKQLTINY